LQSPKFQFVQNDIKGVFEITLLKEEWKKRTKPQIRKQLVFDAIEYRDIDQDLSRLLERVRREVSEGNYVVQSPKRYLAEKSRGLCRQMTLIHPRDLLVLERLSRSVYFELKHKAPSQHSSSRMMEILQKASSKATLSTDHLQAGKNFKR